MRTACLSTLEPQTRRCRPSLAGGQPRKEHPHSDSRYRHEGRRAKPLNRAATALSLAIHRTYSVHLLDAECRRDFRASAGEDKYSKIQNGSTILPMMLRTDHIESASRYVGDTSNLDCPSESMFLLTPVVSDLPVHCRFVDSRFVPLFFESSFEHGLK